MNIPNYLIEATKPDTKAPNPNRIGVTELINPPLQRTLFHKNWDKIQRDPTDCIWMMLGESLDNIVKRYSTTALTKLKLEWNTIHGITIVAVPDLIDLSDGVLADLKCTSVWSVKETKKEYEQQLNLYDLLLHRNKPDFWNQIKGLEIHAILRDWRMNEKLRYHDYPDKQFVILPIERWSETEQEQFLDTQLQDHLKNPNRECSPQEKWQKNDQYAVMKAGRKSALRVLDSLEEAKGWCNDNNYPPSVRETAKISIVKRPGECTRCLHYCQVSKFCPYFRKEKE